MNEQQQNMQMVERSKQMKIGRKDDVADEFAKMQKDKISDKLPKKENESWYRNERKHDIDFEKYGYYKPEKIKPGHLTLRQLDEILNEYKLNKSSQFIEKSAENLKIDKINIELLFKYYKPLFMQNKNSQTGSKDGKENFKIDDVFPNLKLEK